MDKPNRFGSFTREERILLRGLLTRKDGIAIRHEIGIDRGSYEALLSELEKEAKSA